MTMIGDDDDVEVDSQAEREQLRETTTRSEVEKRSRRRSSTLESAGGQWTSSASSARSKVRRDNFLRIYAFKLAE